jgi:hypothetical protein
MADFSAKTRVFVPQNDEMGTPIHSVASKRAENHSVASCRLCRKVEMGIFPVQQLELWRGLQLLCENIPSGPIIPSFRGQMAAEGPS